MRLKLITVLSVFFLWLQSCKKNDVVFVSQPQAVNYSSSVATDWMRLFEKTVQIEGKNPPQASRIYAYAAIGLYESVLPGMPGNYSLQNQIPGLHNLPAVNTFDKLNLNIIANEALYIISKKIFGVLKSESITKIEELHKTILSRESTTTSTAVRDESFAFAKQVAEAVLLRADNDNFNSTRSLQYVVPSPSINPRYWSPTGPATVPLEPYWNKIQCFTMAESKACTVLSTVPFDTRENSLFYQQAKEVLEASKTLTSDEKDIARWWSDGMVQTSTPPGHWVAIADQIALEQKMNLGRASEMYALLTIAMADAFISCWDEKYELNLLRPVTYIRRYIPGNANWMPLLETPPFPEYPSGHSVASGAAATILTRLLGNLAFTDTTNVHLGYPERRYQSFTDAAEEAAISRLYGGIHFKEAIVNGVLQGNEVGKVVLEKLRLRP